MNFQTNRKITRYGCILSILYAIYLLTSYLLFLRDDFILERISVLTHSPNLLIKGRFLAKTFHVNSIPTAVYFFTIIFMFYFYIKSLKLLRGIKQNYIIKIVLYYFAVFAFLSIFSFPALSTDVFDYISSNRVLFVHKTNPWLNAPENFPQDDFIYLGSWKFRASVYGPVQFIFSSLIYFLSGNSIVRNILGFKLLNLFFLLLTILLIFFWLNKKHPKYKTFGIAIFAWNPLVIIETLSNVHNDIIMAFFILSSFIALSNKKLIISSISLALATLSKVSAVLFMPIILLRLLISNKFRKALIFGTVFTVSTVIGFLSLGEGLLGFVENLSVQLGLYLRSLPTIIRFAFVSYGVLLDKANFYEKIIILPAFFIIYFLLLKRVNKYGLINTSIVTMMAYLIIASPMLQPWYLIWILPLMSLIQNKRTQNVLVIFSFTSMLYYVVLFISYYFSPLSFYWQIIMYLTIIIPPLFIWLIPKTWYTHISKQYLI